MRRVVAFFDWKADDWRKKAMNLENSTLTSVIPEPRLAEADIRSQQLIKDGKIAYAYRQAGIRQRMKSRFSNEWKDLPMRLLEMENGDARVRIECH